MEAIIEHLSSDRPWSAGALTTYDGSALATLTMAELQGQVVRAARLLQDRGVKPGDRIGILAKNELEWLLADLASLRLGAVTAGFDPASFAPSHSLVERYGLKFVLTDARVELQDYVDIRALRTEPLGAGSLPPPVRRGPSDITTIKFTSGSTGVPKGLGASAASIDASISAAQKLFGHGPGDALFVYLPLSLLQQRYWVYSAIHYGHDVVVVPYELAFHALKRKEPTVVMGVPSFYDTLRQKIEATAEEREGAGATAGELSARCAKVLGGRIRYLWTGSAPARVSTLRFFEEQCGIPIYEGYGMNETCIVSKNAPGAHRTASVGRVVDGKTVSFDERGVLIVASAYPVATHYMFGGAQAENVFTPDGAVVTGDTGHLDQDGFLYITGRVDDVVALGNGRNVAVRSIEDAIKSWPVIAECVVCGAGESRLVAVVSLARPADSKVLRAHIERVNATLGGYERVADVVVASEPFSIENGLLGSQSKPKRKAIIAAYRDEIARLYGEAPCTTSNPS